MKTRVGHGNSQSGASLVEFALVLPLLLLLLLGVLEFGWGLAQHLEVRHKAREALRFAVVDGTIDEVTGAVCTDGIIDPEDLTEITRTGGAPGSLEMVTVRGNLEEVTGLFGWAWGTNRFVESEAHGRVEQPATNWTVENLAEDSSC